VQNHGHIAELADIFASSSNQIDGEGLIGGRLSISLNGSKRGRRRLGLPVVL
jgi:hypothetical protein